jgi:sugar phosphate permease
MYNSSEKKRDPFRWVMLLFVCLFFFIVLGFTNQSFNIFLRVITEDMGWTTTQRTAIAAAMSSGMIWFVFVAGTLLDRFSAKKILGSVILVAAVLVFLRGQAQGFTFFFMLMFAFGAVSAFYQPACTKIITLWFDKDELTLANGFLTAASPMGQITASYLGVPMMAALGGWKALFMVMGGAAATVAIFFFFLGKDKKSADAALGSTSIGASDLGFWKNIKGVSKAPLFWIYCIANVAFLGTVYAGGSLGQVVLQADPNWLLDPAVSSRIPAFNNITSMCAYVIVPLVIAKIGFKWFRPLAIVGGIIAPIMFYIGYQSYSFWTLAVCMMIAGVFYGAIIPAPKVLMLSLPQVSGLRAGTGLGFYTTIERVGITVMTTFLGTLISTHPGSMAVVLSRFFQIQLISPALLIIAMIIIHKQKKKEAA